MKSARQMTQYVHSVVTPFFELSQLTSNMEKVDQGKKMLGALTKYPSTSSGEAALEGENSMKIR